MKKEVNQKCYEMGKNAFQNGMKCVAGADKALMVEIAKISSPDFSRTKEICHYMDSWYAGWHFMNLLPS